MTNQSSDMMGDIIGFLLEGLFLALGAYLYLFATGRLRPAPDAQRQARIEAFRRDNAGWMRIMGLLLAAISLVNLLLHLRDVLG